ncbi:hypothetical protein PILCRDRAFT_733083 [Piloderma croceum F 1598]|uniref:Secreted protein n=1 Tax=Piloderma croceum (strain F 1598) TaxID=765440 RepID=A0A0C3AH55_PILCF|nr:hypothetical protein PILCRDRAFT_733083 [Piloderma croceum F 1598]
MSRWLRRFWTGVALMACSSYSEVDDLLSVVANPSRQIISTLRPTSQSLNIVICTTFPSGRSQLPTSASGTYRIISLLEPSSGRGDLVEILLFMWHGCLLA